MRRVLTMAVMALVAALVAPGLAAVPAAARPTSASAPAFRPLVLTYYFYWYNADSGLHLQPTDPLPTHPAPAPPVTSYLNVDWHRQQLSDMDEAMIDVALPVYWGETTEWEPWSSVGLDVMIDARRQMRAAGERAPAIGMFYDTSIVRGLDLTTEAGMATFYGHIRDFFGHVPPEHRAVYDGQPVVWIFAPQDNAYDQRVFDYVEARFLADFGVSPFLSLDFAWHGISADASYPWGTAQNGLQASDLVASVGPGYDERLIPGRSGVYRDRDGGNWYQYNLWNALNSGRPLVVIETWNELHEASGIGATAEYGRAYIEMTRSLVQLAFGPRWPPPTVADFDGDSATDLSVYRSGTWLERDRPAVWFGLASDVPVPGDYDGDGVTDRAVYRPSVGGWYVEGQAGVFFGLGTDVPVPGDYDGDGVTERAVFRPSAGGWYVEGQAPVFFGVGSDVPVPGDYDGDGVTDRAVYRPSVGGWYVNGVTTEFLGVSGDVPVPGDYDGDGVTDRAVFRPPVGAWHVQAKPVQYLGAAGDVPLPLPAAVYRQYF